MADKILTIKLNGRIDSDNADSVYDELSAKIESTLSEEIVLDASDLEYISSAGLRSVMKLKKKYGTVSVIDVSDAVYEIFDVTGFTSIMKIQKAYKQYSVEGCEIIGRGAKGTVYRYDSESVIKVYNEKNTIEDIQLEMDLAKKAFILGLPTAISYGVIKVGDNFGSLFELLDADSISNLIAKNKDKLDEYAGIMCRLDKKIHETEAFGMVLPNAKDYAYDWVKGGLDHVDTEKADIVRSLIDALPEVETMIHGDFHSNNVLMQKGEALLIDMDRMATGHPIIELSGMYMFYVAFGVIDPTFVEKFLGFDYETSKAFWKSFLRKYLMESPEDIEEVEEKAALLAYVRLVRRVFKKGTDLSEENQKALEVYMSKIDTLLPKVKTLYW